MKRTLFFCSVVALLFFLGCQSKKVSETPSIDSTENKVVYREGTLEVEDLIKNKAHRVSVESFILPSKKMRIEATGPLGIRIASLIVSEDKIQALLHREKKY